MIASLTGRVAQVQTNTLTLDVSGVGYLIQASPHICTRAAVGAQLTLQTRLIVREDSMTLFGFDTADEIELFDLVTSVSGIGPKSGLAIVSALQVDEIRAAVTNGDDEVFRSVPGIGPKTAKLLVVSLSGRMQPSNSVSSSTESDLVSALLGLGYNEKAAISAVKQAVSKTTGKADALRIALSVLSRRSVD